MNMLSPDDPVYVLIGGNGYIGNKITNELTLYGISVITTYNDNKNRIAESIHLNLMDESSFDDLLKILKPIKKVVIVFLSTVKNSDLILNLSKEKLIQSFTVNVSGPHMLVQKILPQMIKNKWGRFIFFSSTKAHYGDIGISAYSSTKSAISSYSRVLALEYARYGITSNILSLGYFDGPLWDEIAEEKRKILLMSVPSKKLGECSNLTNSLRFLVDSEYVNGTLIKVDGGI